MRSTVVATFSVFLCSVGTPLFLRSYNTTPSSTPALPVDWAVLGLGLRTRREIPTSYPLNEELSFSFSRRKRWTPTGGGGFFPTVKRASSPQTMSRGFEPTPIIGLSSTERLGFSPSFQCDSEFDLEALVTPPCLLRGMSWLLPCRRWRGMLSGPLHSTQRRLGR
jgi:hypothetical protein